MHPLNAELNPICHLLALLGGATIVVVSRLRVKCRGQIMKLLIMQFLHGHTNIFIHKFNVTVRIPR